MADANIFFGTSSYIPSVNVNVNTSALIPLNIGAPLVPAIIGQAQGGVPGAAITIFTPQQAMATLRGGDLLDAVLRCFQPSDFNPGASKIVVMRVNPATQSTATLVDGSAGNTITVTSVLYGLLDNNYAVTIAAGTTIGKKVTIQYNGTGSNPGTQALTYTQDNTVRNSFTLLYTGSSASATATITETALTTSTTTGGAENLNLLFANFPTVGQLVNYINTAYPTLYTAVVTTPNPNDPTAAALDHITAQTIKTTAYQVTATVNAIINYINSTGALTAARASSTTGLVPANQTVVLTGGTETSGLHLDGTANGGHTIDDVHDWGFAITQMANQPVNLEVVLTGDSTVWASLATSVGTTSSTGLYARRAFIGTSLGQTEASIPTLQTDAAAINSDRVYFVGQGITDTNPLTGATTTYAGYILAAQLAGLAAGTQFGNSITAQEIKGLALEWNPTAADLQTMISSGILPLQFTPVFNYIRVVRGVSTWLKDNNFFRTELSTGIAVDKVIQDLSVALQPLLGQGISQLTLYRIQSQTQSTLLAEENLGVLVGDTASPAFGAITVTGQGDTVNVAFTAQFVVPTNFINVSVTAATFSGVLASSSVAA